MARGDMSISEVESESPHFDTYWLKWPVFLVAQFGDLSRFGDVCFRDWVGDFAGARAQE